MLKYMLDTNIVIYTIKNRSSKVRQAFKQHQGQMCLSAVTMGELVYGAEKSSQVERNLADIEGLAALLDIVPFDTQAGHVRRIEQSCGSYHSQMLVHCATRIPQRHLPASEHSHGGRVRCMPSVQMSPVRT